jgi:hypothetical protein
MQAQRIIGQAVDQFETAPAAPGPWAIQVNPPGGNLTLAGGTYIATFPAGWIVDQTLANNLSAAWNGTPNKPRWSNFASNVVQLPGGNYRIDVSATFTPAVGPATPFNFRMS